MSDSALYRRHLEAMQAFAQTVSAHWVAGCVRAAQEPATQRGLEDKDRVGLQTLAVPLHGAQSRFVADLGAQIRDGMEAAQAHQRAGPNGLRSAPPANGR